MECATAGENKCGKITPSTKGIGRMIKLMEGEGLSIPTVMSTKGNGKTIKLMEKVCTCTKMGQSITGIGSKITSMALDFNNGSMGLLTRGKSVTM